MWEAVERYHQLCYWAPEVREEAEKIGLKGFFMNYFATRVAPLGSLSDGAVGSLTFYYSPRRVQRAIPDASKGFGQMSQDLILLNVKPTKV